ncbi:MAG: acetyl-CoA hydrolase/transferase C-terminal domain-containing protein [Bacillota bacterium]|nr:acetyl-CoA hydrolase/transferase C-terminal domain-containing protein [Bacillota bacterium]
MFNYGVCTLSKGGKTILSLHSTYKDWEGNLQSRIVPVLPQGTIVTTSRVDVEYIVTEFGVACLRWKSVADRVKELVKIAHPDFRDQLRFQASKEGWI